MQRMSVNLIVFALVYRMKRPLSVFLSLSRRWLSLSLIVSYQCRCALDAIVCEEKYNVRVCVFVSQCRIPLAIVSICLRKMACQTVLCCGCRCKTDAFPVVSAMCCSLASMSVMWLAVTVTVQACREAYELLMARHDAKTQ